MAAGRLPEAIATVEAALGASPTPELHVSMATLLLRAGDAAGARAQLDAALALDPASGLAHAYLGGLLVQTGSIEEGRAHLDLALELAPRDISVAIKSAEYWLRVGVFDRARADLRKGLREGAGAPGTRALAEGLLQMVERRARNSYTRTTVPLPRLAAFGRPLRKRERRDAAPAPAAAELEAL